MNFKNRVSPDAKEYLAKRKDELKEGYSEDAGLLISFDALYDRIKRWENYQNHFPESHHTVEANYYYTSYLEMLITGMDNSRVFDLETNILLPEVKLLYEKIMNDNPESTTTKIITAYYSFLEHHNFTENDEIQDFLKENNLSTMLGIQPHLR